MLLPTNLVVAATMQRQGRLDLLRVMTESGRAIRSVSDKRGRRSAARWAPITRPGWLAACASIAVSLALAPSALAGQILWAHGSAGSIWAMNDDGSNPHELIDVSAAPGMASLWAPAVDPNGTTVLFYGSTLAFGDGSGNYGNFSDGVYAWSEGSANRLSPAPSLCALCGQTDISPQPIGNGQFVYLHGQSQGIAFFDLVGVNALETGGENGTGGGTAIPSSCDGIGYDFPVVSGPETVASNPAKVGEFAYSGCVAPGTRSGDYDAVWLQAAGAPASSAVELITTAVRIEGLAWSADGSVLAFDDGSHVYWVNADGSAWGTALVAPTGNFLGGDVTFLGNGSIVFGYEKNLYEIPASCGHPTTCTLADATALTTSGEDFDATWTPATSIPTSPPPIAHSSSPPATPSAPSRTTPKPVVTTTTTTTSTATTKTAGVVVSKCIVPRLRTKTLHQAQALLRSAHCSLGTVTTPKGPRRSRRARKHALIVGRVSPGAGSVRPAGTPVNVTLAR